MVIVRKKRVVKKKSALTCIHGKKSCIVCRKKYEVYAKGKKNHSHRSRAKYKRPNWSKTCSSRCSRKYLGNRKAYLKKGKTK